MQLSSLLLVSIALACDCKAVQNDETKIHDEVDNLKSTQNKSELVREMRSAMIDGGSWSPLLGRGDSQEIDPPPFWANRGRREMEELQQEILAATAPDAGKREGKASEELPPFWANRGRREGLEELRLMLKNSPGTDVRTALSQLSRQQHPSNKNHGHDSRRTREISAEDKGPFWANRGRNVDEDGPFWANRGRDVDEDGPFWANRGRDVDENGPFWANRGRDVDENGPFWANRGRDVDENGPFWANRGRDVDENGPFWANRGRNLDENGPFWANRGRNVDEDGPFWANRGRNVDEDGPFWANRGRSLTSNEPVEKRSSLNNDVKAGLKRQLQELLFAEEPSWVPLDRREVKSAGIYKESEPFWISRGRRREVEPDARSRRGLKERLGSREEPFYPSRGRRGLREALSTEEPFWAVRGRRGLRDALSVDDPFWAVRGRRSDHMMEETMRGKRGPSGTPATRAIGVLQDPNFWPVRGKRAQEHDNDEDDKFWDILKQKTISKDRTEDNETKNNNKTRK